MDSIERSAGECKASLNLPIFKRSSAAALERRSQLDNILSDEVPRYGSHDTSIVVFGSLARGEWTSGSDLDWTYLIDGQANSDHQLIAQEIGRVLEKHEDQFPQPGQTGTFGNMAFSHDIIHQIGGQYDTNKNTTRRVLLLLESVSIGRSNQAYERVIKGVINRYLEEDTHLLTPDRTCYRVPRFLLNDIVRFWRTMAVDFASKQRDRGGKGWGLRNAKLRMSRKLIFASGLLVCFSCALDQTLNSKISTDKNDIRLKLINHIREHVSRTPLEIVARAMESYAVPSSCAEELFGAYADFLAILDNTEARRHLDRLRAVDSRKDTLFSQIRSISGRFEHALDYLFFEHKEISPLTRKYAVF